MSILYTTDISVGEAGNDLQLPIAVGDEIVVVTIFRKPVHGVLTEFQIK